MIQAQLDQCNKYQEDLIKMRQNVRLSELQKEARLNAPYMASSIIHASLQNAPRSFMKTELENISKKISE